MSPGRDYAQLDLLSAAIATMTAQLYPQIELLIGLSSLTSSEAARHVETAANRDRRLTVLKKRFRGQAAAFNAGLSVCSGQFVSVFGQHDMIDRSAAFKFASYLANFPDTTILYSDEDQVNCEGRRHSPILKSTWDPDKMMAHDSVGRLAVLAKNEVQRCGGMQAGLDDLEEYDLLLRLGLQVKQETIRHLPSILYQRRSEVVKSKSKIGFFGRFSDPRKRILTEALNAKRDQRFDLSFPPASTSARVEFILPKHSPLASIIIPTRDRVDLLSRCIDGLLYRTAYPAMEIIIIDNDSKESETAAYLSSISSNKRIRIIKFGGAFNWSAMNNFAAANALGDVLVFLNNDIEIVTEKWLREMVSQAIRPAIGVVGAKLLYPDLRIQHAGIVMSKLGGFHTMRFAAPDDPGYLDELCVVHSVSAVTGACMAMRHSVFREIQGFEDRNLKVTWSDVDLCLRVRSRGYRTIWTPWAVLVHHEVATRGPDETPEKIARAKFEHQYVREIWREAADRDYYQNPFLVPSEIKQKLATPSCQALKHRRVSCDQSRG